MKKSDKLLFIHVRIQAFLDISKKTQGQKNSSKFLKKLKQIIQKLNNLPTETKFFP